MSIVLYKISTIEGTIHYVSTGESGRDFCEILAFSRYNLEIARNFLVSAKENGLLAKREESWWGKKTVMCF